MTDSIHHIPAVEGESPAEGHLISLFSTVFYTLWKDVTLPTVYSAWLTNKTKELVKTKAQEISNRHDWTCVHTLFHATLSGWKMNDWNATQTVQRHSLVHWESREDLWGTITRPVALWITSEDPPLRQDLSIKALLIPLVSARMVSKCKELYTEKCCAIQAGFVFFFSKRHLESGFIFLFVCSSLKSFP